MKFENAISLRYKVRSCVILKKCFIIYQTSFFVVNCTLRIYVCNIVVLLYLNITNINASNISILHLLANDVVFIILCLKVKAQFTILPKIHLYLLRFIFASSTYEVIFVHATNNVFKSIYA